MKLLVQELVRELLAEGYSTSAEDSVAAPPPGATEGSVAVPEHHGMDAPALDTPAEVDRVMIAAATATTVVCGTFHAEPSEHLLRLWAPFVACLLTRH